MTDTQATREKQIETLVSMALADPDLKFVFINDHEIGMEALARIKAHLSAPKPSFWWGWWK